MKLLAADQTEHTATFELDNGLEFVASNLHEDVLAEIQKELYGKSFSPSEGQPDRASKQKKAAQTSDTDFI